MATNTIPLATAQEWAKTWRKLEGNYNKHHELKAFFIPGIDFEEMKKEIGAVDVRGYLGVGDDGSGDGIVEHLMLVGVDAQGNDMIDESEGWHIYDFTRPCPTTCDENSPLYTLK